MRKQSALYSVCIHAALVGLLSLTATLYTHSTGHSTSTLESHPLPLYAPPVKPRAPTEGGSSGGGRMNPLPPNRGEIPRVAKVFIPPMPQPRETPKIVLPSGLEDVPQIMAEAPIGIPTGIVGTNSPGPGRGGAFGNGDNGRPGDGHGGPGNGLGVGPGTYAKRPSVLPKLVWKTEPEYTEEARKARYQGSVYLTLEVDQEGRPRNIRVVSPLGLGLDERAVEAVSRWRFKPGLLDGRPVNTPVSVQVTFRLL